MCEYVDKTTNTISSNMIYEHIPTNVRPIFFQYTCTHVELKGLVGEIIQRQVVH